MPEGLGVSQVEVNEKGIPDQGQQVQTSVDPMIQQESHRANVFRPLSAPLTLSLPACLICESVFCLSPPSLTIMYHIFSISVILIECSFLVPVSLHQKNKIW